MRKRFNSKKVKAASADRRAQRHIQKHPKACAQCGFTFWTTDTYRNRCDDCWRKLKAMQSRVMRKLKKERAEKEAEVALILGAEKRL
jgi:hypothetical protein